MPRFRGGYSGRNYGDYEESDKNSNGSGDTSASEPEKKKAKSENIKHKVNEILKTVNNGDSGYEFAISQKLTQAPMVMISLQEGNILRFPIYEQEIDRILDLFEKSPYGKGSETILDTSFRNSYQMSPDKFTILNPSWDNFIKETLVPLVVKELSISDPFIASIYKLLLYKQGSFFKLHRDSEKQQGMFATLIVQLPSKYTGGELLVHHDGKIKTIDFSTDAAPEAEFSACFSVFYCDCLHEINPLKSGVRACLVYNLCLTGENLKPMIAPRSSEAEDKLGTIFENWKELSNTWYGPSKIVYALKHKYTQQNLSFENLKSTDKAIAQLLKAVTTQHQMTLLLAIFEKTSKGEENDLQFHSDDSDYCENDYELTDLRQLDSSDCARNLLTNMKPIPVELKEVISEDCWSLIEPYNSEREETGNEGVNVTLFYRHAAFVIWPTEHLFEIFVHGGDNIDKAENIFLQEYKNTRGISRDEVIEANLLKWAWDLVNNYSSSSCETENASELLSAIADFSNLKLLKKFLQHRKSLTPAKIKILIGQCEKYGWNAFSTELSKMFQQQHERDNALEMLKLFITSKATGEEKQNVCTRLAHHVLKSDKSTGYSYGYSYYGYKPPKDSAQKKLDNEAEKKFLKEFYTITKGIEFNMIQVAEKMPLDIIIPFLLELAVDKTEILRKSWIAMSQTVLKRMEKIAATSLPVPTYHRNDFHSSCGCNDCQLLLGFMQSNEISKRFSMVKKQRLHLHQRMNKMQKLSLVTEEKGSPHTLIVTKTEKTGTEDHWEKQIADKHISEFKQLLEESPPH